MVVTDKGEETRHRILEVASAHFAERGYAGTSLNDLIKETGLTKGGFYFHFDSKATLALEVVDYQRATWQAAVLEAASRHHDAVGQLRAMIHALIDLKRTHPGGAAIGKLCGELTFEPGMVNQIDHFAGWFEITERLFRRAQAEGDMDPAIDPVSAAHYAVGAFIGAESLSDLRGDGDLGRTIDEHISFTFRAVGITAR
jgi:AcrR family transcriptional regulator